MVFRCTRIALKPLSVRPATILMPSAKPAASADVPSFEQALDELDGLVRRMESGELTLDESIAAYKRGAELARLCQSKLAQAELDIRQLEGDLLRPLDNAALRSTDS